MLYINALLHIVVLRTTRTKWSFPRLYEPKDTDTIQDQVVHQLEILIRQPLKEDVRILSIKSGETCNTTYFGYIEKETPYMLDEFENYLKSIDAELVLNPVRVVQSQTQDVLKGDVEALDRIMDIWFES